MSGLGFRATFIFDFLSAYVQGIRPRRSYFGRREGRFMYRVNVCHTSMSILGSGDEVLNIRKDWTKLLQ